MADECHQSRDYEQSNDYRSEHVLQQESSDVSASTSHSYPQLLQRSPDKKRTKDIRSQANSRLPQPHGDDADANKKTCPAEQALENQATGDTCPAEQALEIQATGDTGLTAKETLPQQTTLLPQPHEDEAHTNESAYYGKPLFASDVIGNTRLTIEDIYIEAMTLAAEIRIHRRQLDEKGWDELSRIMEFCHDALHEKLVISSLAKRTQRETDELTDG